MAVSEKPKLKDEGDRQYIKEPKKKRDLKKDIRDCYYTIIEILKKYCDLEESYYPIIALWIIGTYAHDEFEAYPYLYINGSKGTGKSRLLRLISTLSKNGIMIGSLTEAVLFRTAKERTFCIDEFEIIISKERTALRDLLNSGYKRGLVVERSKKVHKSLKEEEYEIEEFDVYTSIVIANISGMERVLGDRCIRLILEKSIDPKRTKLIENFDKDYPIKKIKEVLEEIKDDLCSLVKDKEFSMSWNEYVLKKKQDKKLTPFFKKVDETEIEGRNLELLFPLYFIARLIDEETLDKMLVISQKIVKEREEEDHFENRDMILMRFLKELSKQETLEPLSFMSITNLTNQFIEYLGEGNEWLRPEWLGRALKRLKILKDRKRTNRGSFALIDFEKVKKKA